jgi:hypothetical protein
MWWLGVNERVEVRAALGHLIVMHGQVGVEFTRDAREQPAWRGVQLTGAAVCSNRDYAKVRGWVDVDVA